MRRSLLVFPALLIGLAAAITPAAADTHAPDTVFADTAGTSHEQAVALLVDNGIVRGCGDGLFCSSDVLTRGQFSTMLVAALELEAVADEEATPVVDTSEPVAGIVDTSEPVAGIADTSEPDAGIVDTSEPVAGTVSAVDAPEPDADAPEPVDAPAPRFADIDTSVHGGSMVLLADHGLLNGCEDDLLCPNDPLTRGQLATLLVGAFELPAAPADVTYFIDGGATHGASIEALGHNGIGSGCGPVTFCTNDTVLRSHAAVFMARALGLVDPVDFAPFDERFAEHEELERQRLEQERTAAAQLAEQERVDAIAARGQAAVQVALAQVGKPYQWAAAGPNRFDCSGLVYYSWRQAAGITLPRSSRDMHRALAPISRAELMPGDLVFYHSPVSHVSIYLGGNRVVDAPGSGRTVMIREDGLTRRGVVGYARPGFNR